MHNTSVAALAYVFGVLADSKAEHKPQETVRSLKNAAVVVRLTRADVLDDYPDF